MNPFYSTKFKNRLFIDILFSNPQIFSDPQKIILMLFINLLNLNYNQIQKYSINNDLFTIKMPQFYLSPRLYS